MKRTLIAGLAFFLLYHQALAREAGVQREAVSSSALAESPAAYSLTEVIAIALKNNPEIIASGKRVEVEDYGINMARGERLPLVNLNSGLTRSRYAQPIKPISGPPSAGGFPEFDETIYDISVSFTMPLYRGGRIERGIRIAEIKKAVAEDTLRFSRQELIYNLTGVYYKISQLAKLLKANELTVKQLEEHRKNVELNVKAGTAPRVDLLKTEVELAHARQNRLVVKNNLESAYELLKTLMGIEMDRKIAIAEELEIKDGYPGIEESITRALSQRPDYKAVLKERMISEERIGAAEGKRLPQVNLNGEYGDRSGAEFGFKENWFVGVRLSLPVFDGGIIKSEISSEKKQAEIAKDRERSLRNEIIRQVKDAHLGIENAKERIEETLVSIETARESLRIERLKYGTGGGTGTDVLDAEAALLRAETEYYQALFDKATAIASLRRAIGEENYK